MIFRSDFGVYVCSHIFSNQFPVLEAIRDLDGDWQFLCGQENCAENGEPHYIGVGHLTANDSTINQAACLEVGTYCERKTTKEAWMFGELE
ncbi:hypothetical protein ACR30L_06345 [Psychromonas sp. PT13]|uniref:hypothetical protein n=1 Tax=Psychromonas sp. PT13 TaxID=3439547 RepID=UPI003EBC0747